MRDRIAVCIPTIPPRAALLARAIRSVSAQTVPAAVITVAQDVAHEGAWANRNASFRGSAGCDWVAWLDDDDELYPHHLATLLAAAQDHDADMVWGWFDVITVRGKTPEADPFPQHRGRQYDPTDPHIVPITYLAKRDLIEEAMTRCGGFLPDEIGAWENQDMPLIQAMCDAGGKLHAIDDVTWRWHHHGWGTPGTVGNTSGLPSRW